MTWVFLCRAGGERDLIDELSAPVGGHARARAEGVVLADTRPFEPAFARQAMRFAQEVPANTEAIAAALVRVMKKGRPKGAPPAWTWTLQVVAPDSKDPHDPRRDKARALSEALPGELNQRLDETTWQHQAPTTEATRLAQVWIIEPARALVGLTPANAALTSTPGGTLRLRRDPDAVSRAGLKLEETIAWVGVGPDKGDLVVDLGAAPGGWSQVAMKRGATVIAVDPAVVRITAPPRRFTHVTQSAFHFVPVETLDWVLCDMAHRPLDVAKLLAKWAKRGWARQMIANVKLPMKKKAEILGQIRKTLQGAGWTGLRARQLFYDRDEVTLFAWLDPKLVVRGPRPPFRPRKTKAHRPRSRKRIRQKSVKQSPRSS